MIKVILFDADGVLIPKKHRFSQILAEKHNISLEDSAVFFSGIFQECLIGKADLKAAISPYLTSWGWKKSVDEFLELWFTCEHFLDQTLLDYIQLLRKKGVKSYVATNNEAYRASYMMDKMGFSEIFEQVFASGNLGFKKPDHEFFKAIMKKLGSIKKHEVLFLDDSLENVESAKEFGLKAELYTDFNDFKRHIKIYFGP